MVRIDGISQKHRYHLGGLNIDVSLVFFSLVFFCVWHVRVGLMLNHPDSP